MYLRKAGLPFSGCLADSDASADVSKALGSGDSGLPGGGLARSKSSESVSAYAFAGRVSVLYADARADQAVPA